MKFSNQILPVMLSLFIALSEQIQIRNTAKVHQVVEIKDGGKSDPTVLLLGFGGGMCGCALLILIY